MAEILLYRGYQSRNDRQFRDAAGCCDGGAAEAGEVVAVGVGEAFEDSGVAKAAQLTGVLGKDAEAGQSGRRGARRGY